MTAAILITIWQSLPLRKNWLGAQKGSKKPWAAFVSLVSPHYPLTAPQEFYDMYDPANVDLPIGYEKPMDTDHSELKNIKKFLRL